MEAELSGGGPQIAQWVDEIGYEGKFLYLDTSADADAGEQVGRHTWCGVALTTRAGTEAGVFWGGIVGRDIILYMCRYKTTMQGDVVMSRFWVGSRRLGDDLLHDAGDGFDRRHDVRVMCGQGGARGECAGLRVIGGGGSHHQ